MSRASHQHCCGSRRGTLCIVDVCYCEALPRDSHHAGDDGRQYLSAQAMLLEVTKVSRLQLECCRLHGRQHLHKKSEV